MLRSFIALLSFGILLIAFPAFAQVDFTGYSALTISANPAHPSPNTTVTLTAESPLLDLYNSDISWTVNGTSAGSGSSITVKLGAVGQETDVAVSVSGPSGSDSAQVALVPTSIDLLWESDSYTPPFYLGRAVPGSSSMIRLLAVPHFVQANGTPVASSGINYTWKVNGATLKGQSGIGVSSVIVPAAILYGTDTITVDAVAGSLTGEASVSVRTADPQLLLYEDTPLFGIMYHRALSDTTSAQESESSFAAIPYFTAVASPNDSSLAYSWSVNGSQVATDPEDPSEITINAKSAGAATVGLSISNPSDPFFTASGSWMISFSQGAPSGGNVFESTN